MINKKFKLKKFIKIQQEYKQIYIFRYNNLTINEITKIKKNLKKLGFEFFFIKKKLVQKSITNLKGQGSTLMIYSSNSNFLTDVDTFKRLELIFFKMNSNMYSKSKIQKILLKKQKMLPLNFSLMQSLFNFLYSLSRIKLKLKADIA